MAYAIALCSTFGLVLWVTVRHERQRRGAPALSAPRDVRTALGDALVEGLVMVCAVAVVIATVVMRNG
jgi:hypothetical protein